MTPNPKPVVNAAHPAQSSFTALVTLLASFRTGIRTTEFWVALIAVIMPQLLALLDKLPASTAGIITGLCALGYHVLRGTQKSSQADALLNGLRTIADHIAETPQETILGGGTAPAVVVPTPAPSSPAPAAATALALFALLTFTGCAGFGAKIAKLQASPVTQAVERDALKLGISFLESSLTGQDMAAGWGIAAGLNTIADAVKALPNPQTAELVRDTAVAFSGSRNANVSILATQLANAFGVANPKSPAERTAAVLALASGINAALTTAPAK